MKILIAEKRVVREMASKTISNRADNLLDTDIPLEMIIFVNDSEKHHDPHMHVQIRPYDESGKNTSPVFETCVRIDVAEYSLHSRNFKPFPTQSCKDLFVKLINSPIYLKKCNVTVESWRFIVDQRDRSMSTNELSDDIEMPNYSTLTIDSSSLYSINRRLDAIVQRGN